MHVGGFENVPLTRLNVVNSNATKQRDQQSGKSTLILRLLTSYSKKKKTETELHVSTLKLILCEEAMCWAQECEQSHVNLLQCND